MPAKQLLTVLLLMICTLLMPGCAGRPGAAEQAKVQHVVLCWLKEPGNADHRRRLIEVTNRFRLMPEVLSLQVGEVIHSDREIVDDSFDVGIVIQFATVEDMQRYLQHPVHVQAVKKVIAPLTSRIVVYDIMNR